MPSAVADLCLLPFLSLGFCKMGNLVSICIFLKIVSFVFNSSSFIGGLGLVISVAFFIFVFTG